MTEDEMFIKSIESGIDEDEKDVCEGCGSPVYGEGGYSDDDVWLCGPCLDSIPADRA
jgi:hypothetical protein